MISTSADPSTACSRTRSTALLSLSVMSKGNIFMGDDTYLSDDSYGRH